MRIIPRLVLTTLTMSALAACDRSVKEKPATSETPTGNHIPNKTAGGLRLVSESQAACVDLDLTKILSSYEVTKCDGSKVMGLIEACKEDSTIGCLTTATYKSADLTNLQAGNILSGMTIAGVSGSVTPAPADCLSDGETGCVAVTNFPAVDKVNNITANASKIRSSVTIAGVVGSLADCSADGGVGCVAIGPTYAAAVTVGAASKILSGQSVAGIAGNVTLPQAGKVYTGIAYGVLGNGSTGSLTLPSVVDVLAGSAPYGDPGSSLTPAMANRGSWALTAAFPGAGYYSGISAAPVAGSMLTGTTVNAVAGTIDLTNLTEGNIKNGTTIAGVAGLYPNATYKLPSAGAAAGLTNATFDAKVKSAIPFEYWTEAGAREQSAGDVDITAANIANGVSVFGLTGTLTGGSTPPNAWDVRVGTVINGVTGKLKVNCRNRVRSALYNYDGAVGSIPNTGVATGSTNYDYWDTIEDYNGGATGLPTSVVTGWTNNDCGGKETVLDDANVWKDITTTDGTTASNCATTTANCTMKDKITGLHWSKMRSASQTWSVAINTCDALIHNSQSDWRLPTQKELMEAYTHGIWSAASANWMTEFDMSANYFWSGSSVSFYPSDAWRVNLAKGLTHNAFKSSPSQVVCVR